MYTFRTSPIFIAFLQLFRIDDFDSSFFSNDPFSCVQRKHKILFRSKNSNLGNSCHLNILPTLQQQQNDSPSLTCSGKTFHPILMFVTGCSLLKKDRDTIRIQFNDGWKELCPQVFDGDNFVNFRSPRVKRKWL